MSDRGPPLVVAGGRTCAGHVVYVDNAGVMSTSAKVSSSAIAEAQRDFERDGLKFHEVMTSEQGGVMVGWHLDGRRLMTCCATKRFAVLRKTLSCVLRRGRISGYVLEVVVGHCTFFGLVRREMLSISLLCIDSFSSTT